MNIRNELIGQAIEAQRAQLAEVILVQHQERNPHLNNPVGLQDQNQDLQSVSDSLSFLSEAIITASPSLFSNYLGWIKVRDAGSDRPPNNLITRLEISSEVLRSRLPPEMGTIAADYIDAGLKKLQVMPDTVTSFIRPTEPLGALAEQYLAALLNTERHLASQLILDAVAAGTGIKDIYLHVFQPVQQEIGRLWQTNEISVAQEHFCTAATQMVMSQLYPYIFNQQKKNCCLVSTCVGSELHEVGLRMVTDFFEMEGWDTYYLGANVPNDSVLSALVDQKADILAISATMTSHIGRVRSLIEAVRAHDDLHQVKIIVGGYPFNIEPDLWRQIKADGYAHNAQAAIDWADLLVS